MDQVIFFFFGIYSLCRGLCTVARRPSEAASVRDSQAPTLLRPPSGVLVPCFAPLWLCFYWFIDQQGLHLLSFSTPASLPTPSLHCLERPPSLSLLSLLPIHSCPWPMSCHPSHPGALLSWPAHLRPHDSLSACPAPPPSPQIS